MIQRKSIEHMEKGWCKKAGKAKPLLKSISNQKAIPPLVKCKSTKRCLITKVSHKKHLMMGKIALETFSTLLALIAEGFFKLLNLSVSNAESIIWKWKELSEELSKSQGPHVESFRKTWD